ncbi:MAG: cohesin domain-containing protein, partial [Saprospiraceae bacterium]
FFNTDPGFDQGSPITVSGATIDHDFTPDISQLSAGTHQIYIRLQNAAGEWSLAHVSEFEKKLGFDPNLAGCDGNWSTAACWASGAVPTVTDKVQLDGVVNIDIPNVSVAELCFNPNVVTGITGGDLTVTEKLVWETAQTSSLAGAGKLILANGAMGTISGTGLTLERTLEIKNGATLEHLDETLTINGTGSIENNGTFLAARNTSHGLSGTGSFCNNNEFRKCDDITTTYTVGIPFANKGTGFISGVGTLIVNSNLNNNGAITPGCSPGELMIEGDFSTGSGVQIEIDGNTLDKVTATGNITLGSDLTFCALNNCGVTPVAPTDGTYTLIETTGGMLSGSFANVLQLPVGGSIHQTSTTLQLVVNSNPAISGNISYPTGGNVAAIDVQLSGDATASILTDPNGSFNFANLTTGGNYTVTPQETTHSCNSILDMLAIRKHILAIEAINDPYLLIAADANNNGGLTTFDIVVISKDLLQIQPMNDYYFFAPSSHTFNDPSFPFGDMPSESISFSNLNQNETADFIAVARGNATGVCASNLPAGNTTFSVADVNSDANCSTLRFPVTVADFSTVQGFQFTISFDPAVLQYNSVDKLNTQLNFNSANIGTTHASSGDLTAYWIDNNVAGKTLSNGDVLFELIFDLQQAVTTTVDINSSRTAMMYVDSNGDGKMPQANSGSLSITPCIAEAGAVNPPAVTQIQNGDDSPAYTADYSVLTDPNTTSPPTPFSYIWIAAEDGGNGAIFQTVEGINAPDYSTVFAGLATRNYQIYGLSYEGSYTDFQNKNYTTIYEIADAITNCNICADFTEEVGSSTISLEVRPNILTVTQGGAAGSNAPWLTPYAEVQDAIDAAQAGDIIWVATGTFTPTKNKAGVASGGRDRTFYLNKDVEIYGSFTGSETDLSQRDPSFLGQSILSGDFQGNDQWTGSNPFPNVDVNIVGDNAYHVLWLEQLSNNMILDGFTIIGGDSDVGSTGTDARGGGIYNNGAGGMSTPLLNHCWVIGNYAAEFGAGIYNDGTQGGNASLTFSNGGFYGNAAYFGSAVYNDGSSGEASPTFANCYFTNHFTEGNGAIVNNGNGGNASPAFENCTFQDNFAADYAGVLFNDATNGNVTPTFINCLFTNNEAGGDGGVALNVAVLNANGSTSGYCAPQFYFCTFADNIAANGSVLYNYGSTPEVHNSILWGNTGSPIEDFGQQTPTIQNSIIEGGYLLSTTVLDQDPLFVDPNAGDYRLMQCSPAIDANQIGGAAPTNDLDDNQRTDNLWDWGAYEYSGAACVTNTVYVNDNATGNNDGTSWANAYTDLQTAIEDAKANNKEEIWIAEGVYYPTKERDWTKPSTPTNQNNTFYIDFDVKVYGGFPDGGNPGMGDRDWDAFKTILSGDADRNSGGLDDVVIISDPLNEIKGANYYSILTAQLSTIKDSEIDGIIISAASYSGMNLKNTTPIGYNSTLRLHNSVISGNAATYGGAVRFDQSGNGTVNFISSDCQFNDNYASYNGGVFYSNYWTHGNVNININASTFVNNQSNRGGVVYSQARYWTNTSLAVKVRWRFYNSLFANNRANAGGILYYHALIWDYNGRNTV